jgi:hypothetical protein
MAPTRLLIIAIALSGTVALAGCGGSSGTGSSSTAAVSTTQTSTGSSSTGTVTASSTGSTSTGSTSTSAATGAENLLVTKALRAELVQAGAAMNGLPASAYTGLVAGQTYYAYDPGTGTFWAGSALVPSHSSQRAQVSVQDDGGYVLFSRPDGGSWKGQPVGLTGTEGAKCPTAVPPPVLAVWGWAPGTCRPNA